MSTKARSGTLPPPRPAALGGPPAFAEPLYVTRPLLPPSAALQNRLASIFASGLLTNNGPMVRELEQRLQARLGGPPCLAFCNGTVALQVALRSLGLSGEVITTPFTFPATVHAIEWNGLKPVFCDVDPHTYNLDPEHARALVTEETTALLPVHVFGNPCDVDALGELAHARGLRLIYDAAHAFGVMHRGEPIGRFGDLSIFSFHATKLFHTCEGGAIVSSDPSRREDIALLRNFGIVSQDEVRGVGLNGKLSEMHAAVGLCLLDRVDEEMRSRAALAELYRTRLNAVEGCTFQAKADDTVENHTYFSVEIDTDGFGLSRDQLHAALRAENVMSRRYFFPLCSVNPCYRTLDSARPENLPNAHRLASRILCLPLYGELGSDNVDRIVDCLLTIKARAADVRRSLHEA